MGIQPVTTVQNQVYQSLKDEICSGSFQPGIKLQEQQLAEQFHVSRSPIREALRKLASDGLVEEIPNRGVFVRKITETDIKEIYEVRVMLENEAIRHLTPAIMAAHENDFLDLLEQMQKAFQRNNLQKYIDLDTKLHKMIVSVSGNSLLCTLYDRVESHFRQFRRYSLADPVRLAESLQEHEKVIHLLFHGNVEEACRMNQKHLLLAKDKILEHFYETV